VISELIANEHEIPESWTIELLAHHHKQVVNQYYIKVHMNQTVQECTLNKSFLQHASFNFYTNSTTHCRLLHETLHCLHPIDNESLFNPVHIHFTLSSYDCYEMMHLHCRFNNSKRTTQISKSFTKNNPIPLTNGFVMKESDK